MRLPVDFSCRRAFFGLSWLLIALISLCSELDLSGALSFSFVMQPIGSWAIAKPHTASFLILLSSLLCVCCSMQQNHNEPHGTKIKCANQTWTYRTILSMHLIDLADGYYYLQLNLFFNRSGFWCGSSALFCTPFGCSFYASVFDWRRQTPQFNHIYFFLSSFNWK